MANRWIPAVLVAFSILFFTSVLAYAYHESKAASKRNDLAIAINSKAIVHLCEVQQRQAAIATTLVVIVNATIARDNVPSGLPAVDARKRIDAKVYSALLPGIKSVLYAIHNDKTCTK